MEATDKKLYQKELGTGEYTVLAFHNQWLYGRSALLTALNVLSFASQRTYKEKTNKDNTIYNNPLFIRNGFTLMDMGGFKGMVSSIKFIINYLAKNDIAIDARIGGSWYEKEINHDFTMGDNNDGITIIDTIENKYCFMNIYEQDTDDNGHGAYMLPSLIPSTALDYVRCYYGENDRTYNNYRNFPADKVLQEADKNRKNNLILSNKFKKYPVLTLDEVKVMFPKVKQIKKILVTK